MTHKPKPDAYLMVIPFIYKRFLGITSNCAAHEPLVSIIENFAPGDSLRLT
jgi:hypothetical protein